MKKFLSAALAVMAAAGMNAHNPFDYGHIRRGVFSQRSVYGLRSMADGEHYTTTLDGNILKHSYRTGEIVDTLFKGKGLKFSDYAISGDETKILLTTDVKPIYRHSFTARYLVADVATGAVSPVCDVEGQRLATFSPVGDKVAFVSGNNLYITDLATKETVRVTDDGRYNEIINGAPDWVYEEEFGFSRAFAFSPDAGKIAYMRFDESKVREFAMTKFEGELYPVQYSYKYPKAGESNAVVELWVYDIKTGEKTKVDVGEQTDQYIPRIGWTPSGELYFFRVNRLQNLFEVVLASGRVIYSELSPRYVDRIDDGTVTFLADGDRFIVKNETESGYMHLYLYSIEKGLLRALTSGEWEVTQLVGVAGDKVYYVSTETSPLRRNLYSVKLNGKGKRRLTEQDGTYRIVPSSGMKYYMSYFSSSTAPLHVTLHSADGRLIRDMEDNSALRERLSSMQLHVPEKEFFTFATERGDTLYGYLKKPYGFDPEKRYPVLMTQYSGPGSQSVSDSWGIGWEDVLVQNGYIVACVDGRGTGYRGEEFKKCTYRNLGGKETEDQISAARYIGSLPFVDASRIGIYGWSFGGFMALNCILKGADVFKMAIAVAPVTSWRYYDTIYTEVYNGLPQDNAAGYDDNSPINFADRLQGRLLLIHGSADDNVHVQNSMEMASALIRAGKQFDMMIYPDDNHSMVPSGVHNIREKMVEYTLKNL